MSSTARKLMSASGAGAGEVLNVEDVFSTYLYTGNNNGSSAGPNPTHAITNGINLADEGGLVWLKARDSNPYSNNHFLLSSADNYANVLFSNNTDASSNAGQYIIDSVQETGFTLGYYGWTNYTDDLMASWTFRKAPKFFDVVTYTGNGSSQNLSHNLGTIPGCVVFKRTDSSTNWLVWHRNINGTDADGSIKLNSTAAKQNGQPWDWDGVTDTYFPLTSDWTEVNASGGTYVAYFFAHNDGDGDFGPDGDADIIKCGSYTGDGTEDGSNVVDLGFEPQWVLVKNTSSSWGWVLQDNMRGLTVSSNSEPFLSPDSSAAESSFAGGIDPTSTGFALRTDTPYLNTSGDTYIYIAIRRGTKVPESATEVFAIDEGDGVGAVSAYTSGFPVDFAIDRTATGTSPNYVGTRLLQGTRLQTNDNNAEASESAYYFDYMEGWRKFSRAAGNYSWMWKRAPKYFDVVAYTGNQTAGRTVTHNLGAVPEMMWIKSRNGSGSSYNWICYLSALGTTHYAILNETYINPDTSNVHFNGTAPTSTVFSLGTSLAVNRSGYTYVAYLFASLAGISKVSSVTHSGTTNVDCGFTSGARFVLLKRTDADDNWYVWDSERGIVSGNDPYLLLNTTAAEVTNTDYIDPLSSGFTITSSFTAGDYAFYALA